MTAPRPDVRPSETARPVRYRPDPVSRPAPADPMTRPSEPAVSGDATGAPVRPRTDPRPARPHRHLAAFAIAIPASGAAGFIVGTLDVFSTVSAVAFPVAVFVGVMTARVLLFRVFRWVRAVVAVVAGWYR